MGVFEKGVRMPRNLQGIRARAFVVPPLGGMGRVPDVRMKEESVRENLQECHPHFLPRRLKAELQTENQ